MSLSDRTPSETAEILNKLELRKTIEKIDERRHHVIMSLANERITWHEMDDEYAKLDAEAAEAERKFQSKTRHIMSSGKIMFIDLTNAERKAYWKN